MMLSLIFWYWIDLNYVLYVCIVNICFCFIFGFFYFWCVFENVVFIMYVVLE